MFFPIASGKQLGKQNNGLDGHFYECQELEGVVFKTYSTGSAASVKECLHCGAIYCKCWISTVKISTGIELAKMLYHCRKCKFMCTTDMWKHQFLAMVPSHQGQPTEEAQ